MAAEERLDSLAPHWPPSWFDPINLPSVPCMSTSHYMNSHLMEFTRFLLLSLRENVTSQQRSASHGWKFHARKRKKNDFCVFLAACIGIR